MRNKIYRAGILGIMLLSVLGFSNRKENRVANDLNGIWGLTNYFDTIVANKELAKYRLQRPTWFAILLKIEADSLACFGSIERARYPLNGANDTLTILSSFVTGHDWYLIRKGDELQVVPVPNEENSDTTIYTFRKRDDLASCVKADFQGIDVRSYFNDRLFRGKYINMQTQQEVVFSDNGKLIGIEGFNAYEVRDYFGTRHPYDNLDVICFLDDNSDSKPYNWVFSADELLLTEFIPEKVTDEDGDSYDNWDHFVLGKERIRLKKVENEK